MRYSSICPGKAWLDTNGNKIHAHGGSVMFLDGVYYWYGENKEKTDGKNGIWHWGVRCYASTDLYNWEDKELIIPPQTDNETSTLHPKANLDRPHIIFNKKTNKFVCWLKIMHDDGTQKGTILTADNFLGPYTLIKEGFMPLGFCGGDFDLAVADDGTAYYYFEKVHTETICADLTEDFLDVTGQYSSHFPHSNPPYVREAIAHFFREGKHYLITSGTTWYLPNPSEVAVSKSWHGPFKVLGNPHRNDKSDTSFHSQISSIFKVHGKKDLYIACADRWLPDAMHLKYHDYEKLFDKAFTKGFGALTLDEINYYKEFSKYTNTSRAEYVWLPLKFENDMVYIDWYDEWKIEDFE